MTIPMHCRVYRSIFIIIKKSSRDGEKQSTKDWWAQLGSFKRSQIYDAFKAPVPPYVVHDCFKSLAEELLPDGNFKSEYCKLIDLIKQSHRDAAYKAITNLQGPGYMKGAYIKGLTNNLLKGAKQLLNNPPTTNNDVDRYFVGPGTPLRRICNYFIIDPMFKMVGTTRAALERIQNSGYVDYGVYSDMLKELVYKEIPFCQNCGKGRDEHTESGICLWAIGSWL